MTRVSAASGMADSITPGKPGVMEKSGGGRPARGHGPLEVVIERPAEQRVLEAGAHLDVVELLR